MVESGGVTGGAIAARILAAICGGYFLSSSFAIFLSCTLPVPRAEAVLAATLLSLLVYVAAIIWAFAARTVSMLWATLMLPSFLMLALAAGLNAQQ